MGNFYLSFVVMVSLSLCDHYIIDYVWSGRNYFAQSNSRKIMWIKNESFPSTNRVENWANKKKNGWTIPLKIELLKQFLFNMHTACVKVPAGAYIRTLFSALSIYIKKKKGCVEFIDPRRTAAPQRQILIKVRRKMVSQQLSAMLTIKLDIWEVMDVSATLFYTD